jgi:hypothetical protein
VKVRPETNRMKTHGGLAGKSGMLISRRRFDPQCDSVESAPRTSTFDSRATLGSAVS